MQQFASKWHLPALLYLPDSAGSPGFPLQGTLAELIKTALETVPGPACRRLHIECGDTILGHEAITYAYYSIDFPLPRQLPPVRR